jgi:uncharacterized protein YprB with RNaseH-like and TPR domain
MRDLASRLREIVRQHPQPRPPQPAARDLTCEADIEAARDVAGAAARLGGAIHEGSAGACIVVDRAWAPDDRHGRRRVDSFAPRPAAPLALFDARLAGLADWADRVVFFDIETTGLSGGAGMLAFLAGCGWFENGAFRIRQFFLAGPSGERAMLDALAGILAPASLLVTYNGRTFDVPTMETRWAFHRTANATDALPHFDMLPPARRLWQDRGQRAEGTEGRAEGRGRRAEGEGRRAEDKGQRAEGGCSLTSLERSVLGFHRIADVPGFEIPARYFHFLRTSDAGAVEGVLEHNRLDILSLAAVTALALEMAEEGPHACRDACEQVGLGRLYERAGDAERAGAAYRLAAAGAGDADVRLVAFSRLAELLRRADRHDEAAEIWTEALGRIPRGRRRLSLLERVAAERLAIHLEHRRKDPAEARRYAEMLRLDAAGRRLADADHRIGRLDRKVRATGPGVPGPSAATLGFE